MWRKLRIPLALLLVLVVVTHADTPPAGKEQLRKLTRLPTISFNFGFDFNQLPGGLSDLLVTLEPAQEIASLQKAMDGGPADAGRYYRLSQLYGKPKQDKDKATQNLNKSIELFRRQVERQPENGRLLADFGEALADAGHRQEAEEVLRKSVRLATNDWHGWVNLGGFLQAGALATLSAPEKAGALSKDAPAQMKHAQDCMDEAMSCFDKAAVVTPGEPQVYVKRACACYYLNWFRGMVQSANGNETDPVKIAQAVGGGDDLLKNLKETARLSPRNPRAIGAVVALEFLHASAPQGIPDDGPQSAMKSLPEKSQQAVRDGMASLRKMEDDPDGHVAAEALDIGGTIEFTFMNDPVAGEKKLRQATALDPANPHAAEALTGLLAIAGNPLDLLANCEARVKQNPTPHNLLLLAKAHDKLGHATEAEQQMRAAVKLAPDDFTSQLGLASLLMRHTDGDSMSEAASQLKLAAELFAKIPADKQTNDQKTDQLLAVGIYLGLTGQTEDARTVFNKILEIDDGNPNAKAGLVVLQK